MTNSPPLPPTRRQVLIARSEQAVLVVLALVVVAGVAYRALSYWRVGAEPLAPVPEAAPTYRVNVNAADWVTLALVPGLGETLAKRIVAQRERSGGRFDALDDLLAVKGIGAKTLASLRPYLVAGDPAAPGEPVEMLEGP